MHISGHLYVPETSQVLLCHTESPKELQDSSKEKVESDSASLKPKDGNDILIFFFTKYRLPVRTVNCCTIVR